MVKTELSKLLQQTKADLSFIAPIVQLYRNKVTGAASFLR